MKAKRCIRIFSSASVAAIVAAILAELCGAGKTTASVAVATAATSSAAAAAAAAATNAGGGAAAIVVAIGTASGTARITRGGGFVRVGLAFDGSDGNRVYARFQSNGLMRKPGRG